MQSDDFLDKYALGASDIFNGLAWHRLRHEADEVAGMARLHYDADLTIRLKAADAWTVAGTRVDHDKRTPGLINLDTRRRRDSHQAVIDRPLQVPSIRDQLERIVENMRHSYGHMLAILLAAAAHGIQKQDTALTGIHEVFEGGCEKTRQCIARSCRLFCHDCSSLSPRLTMLAFADGLLI